MKNAKISQMLTRNSMINRADLVYWLKRDKSQMAELEHAATLLGFERKIEKIPVISKPPRKSVDPLVTDPGPDVITNEIPSEIPDAKFVYIADREQLATEQEVAEQTNIPQSIQGVGEFTPQELAPLSTKTVPLQALISWSRLWPVLKKRLHSSRQSTLDIPGLIEQLAAGRLQRRLPRLQRTSWAAQIEILLDDHSRLIPFHGDFDSICESLQDLVGQFNLNVWKVGDNGTGNFVFWGQPERQVQHWDLPLPSTPVLILSDLGMLSPADSASRRYWLRLGRQLKAVGVTPFVLAPVSTQHIELELSAYFHITLWNKNSRLQPQSSCAQPPLKAALQQLLVLLSPAVRIEPALLRAVRHCLPADQFDAGCEAEFWLHADVQVSPIACCIRDEETILMQYRCVFSDQTVALQRQVIKLLRQHHARLFPAILHEETLIWASLVRAELQAEYQQEIDTAELFMRKMAAMLYQRRDRPDNLQHLYGIRHLERSDTQIRQQHRYFSVVEGVVNRDKISDGMPLRAGIDRDELLRTLARGEIQRRACTLYQQGQQLILAEQVKEMPTQDLQNNSRYTELLLMGDSLLIEQTEGAKPVVEQYLSLEQLPKILANIHSEIDSIRLQTPTERITLKNRVLPERAEAIGRDQAGLWLEFEQHNQIWRVYWPEWGGELEFDEYGLYTDFTIRDVTQRFRWIAPGTFLMGSPESEVDRDDDEIQHQVTLTQGYWLADTACTQALWQAVMGDNPAAFNDDSNRPVEQVSWNEVQAFIEKLNTLMPELTACLPTEAQWEYACRAGTETPFSFGEHITSKQVNFDGTEPYAQGGASEYRETTVAVKSLPENPWGLYEMHGNIWEWCQDGFEEYPDSAMIDPVGAMDGSLRVLRGGSWIFYGLHARSAYRHRYEPGYRDSNIGFRLALGQTAESMRQERKQQEPASAAAADSQRGSAASQPLEHKWDKGKQVGWLDNIIKKWKNK